VRAPSVAEQLRAIARALAPLEIRWFVFGAQAVVAAGAVRQTADIDITTADVPASRLLAALRRAGYVLRRDVPGVDDLVRHHRILPLEHRTSGLQLDVVRAGPGLEEDMLERVVHRRVGRASIPFVETNDLLVLKTLAGRPKDLEDIRALLRSGSPEIAPAVVRARLRVLEELLEDDALVARFDAQAPPRRRSRRVGGSAATRPAPARTTKKRRS